MEVHMLEKDNIVHPFQNSTPPTPLRAKHFAVGIVKFENQMYDGETIV